MPASSSPDSSWSSAESSRHLSPLPAVFPAAVNRPDDFFDQKPTFYDVMSTFQIGARRPILLQGERGVGKTSLLLRIGHALQHDAIPGRRLAHFFISPGRLDAWERFAWELLDGLSLTLEAMGLSTFVWEKETLSQSMTFNRLVMLAKRLMEPALYRNPDLGIVIMMDEIDKGTVRPQVLDKTLASIHYLVEKTQLPLYFLMTMIAPNLPDPPAGSPMPAKIIRIPLFHHEALQDMLTAISHHEGLMSLLPHLRDWISRYSGGHPYIAKLLLTAVLKICRESGDDAGWEPERYLARAIHMEEARQLFGDVYRRFFNEEEKAIMLELAARSGNGIPLAEMERCPAAFQRAWLNLESRGYVQRDRGVLRNHIHMWPAWLRAWPAFALERKAHPFPSRSPDPQSASHPLPPGVCIIRSTQQVFVDGREIHPRAFSRTTFRALLYLAEHAGEVVSKDALGNAIYPGEHYAGNEQQLDSIIFRLRKALGDRQPYRFVRTLRGRGYRMTQVAVLDSYPDDKETV